MQPDRLTAIASAEAVPGDIVAGFVRVVSARIRRTRIAEGLALGALAALVVIVAGLALAGRGSAGANLALLGATLAVGAGVASAWIGAGRQTWSAGAAAAETERALPALRNHLITALELEASPDRASSRIRAQVAAYAARIVEAAPLDTVHPARRGRRCLVAAAAAAAAGVVAWAAMPDLTHRVASRSASNVASSGRAGSRGIARLDVAIAPPPYTGRPEQTLENPERLEVITGSRLHLRITSGAASVGVELGDIVAPTPPAGGETVQAIVTPITSGLLTIVARDSNDGVVDRRLVPVIVRPDAPPEVTIEKPQTDLTLDNAAARVTFAARASDDLGLASLTLHYTKVTGSGENYAFKEGELPLALVRESAGRWRGDATRELSTLGLQEGDLLVYFARATDRRPGAQPSVSDSYVIEIGKPNTAIAGGFAVPAEKDKTAISMSALLAKTEKLHAARGRLGAATVAEQATGLAVEQRMVRSETLFLMGAHGEVEDEEAEAEHSNEIQEGRLENRGQADLRLATRLMSEAERHLLMADTGAALPAQRTALAAMQRALSKQRYFLRTMPVRSQIDLTRRLSGDLSGARAWRRRGETRPADERAAAVREVLDGLDRQVRARLARGKAATSVNPPAVDAPDLLVLARDVLALDPEQAALQQAARELARLADPTLDWSTATQREALARIVAAVQQQAARLPAAPAAPTVLSASPLRGAFADALRREAAPR